MTKRYTVYREYVSGRDGEKAFDMLSDAQRDYDDATRESSVVRVELQDNGTNFHFIVECFDAREPSDVAR